MVACAPGSPRALPTEVVAEAARAAGLKVVVAESVAEAVELARSVVAEDGLVVVTGSLYVVADVRQLVVGDPRPDAVPPPG